MLSACVRVRVRVACLSDLAALPVDIGVGRLILYGSLLRCAWPILLIAAALSDRSPFLSPIHKRDEAKLVQSTFNLAQSDHLAAVEAHRRWDEACRNGGKQAGCRFCDKHFLSERTLQGMTDMANQFWDQLGNSWGTSRAFGAVHFLCHRHA